MLCCLSIYILNIILTKALALTFNDAVHRSQNRAIYIVTVHAKFNMHQSLPLRFAEREYSQVRHLKDRIVHEEALVL